MAAGLAVRFESPATLGSFEFSLSGERRPHPFQSSLAAPINLHCTVRAICANRGDSQQPLADVHSRKSGSVSGYRSREEPALIRRLDENPSFCRPTMLEEFDLAQALFRLFKRFVRPAEIFSFLR
jgi:hypothetical protein